MRVQLRGLSGDPALNGQCGKVGGFEGERVFVRLDNSNRVVKVKTINVRKEGGNAAWTRGEAEGGLGGLFGGVMDAIGGRLASGEDSNQITELRERAERAERRADRLEVDAGARGEALAEARAELRQRSATGRPLVEQLRELDVAPARCDSAKLAELSDALAAATAKVSEEKARRAVQNEGEQKCVVCLESNRDVVFMPCFHVVSCWNCGLRVSECPVCRVAIQQKRRVYS
ncbi:unnamed protein product [Pelagomonas calceolata]|uniref:RING-type domain-containing protein n=1 Tax=Pelagomonas calceolata TaxID=35677 RepID=A0A8J2SUD2_9STRA|nr:unnamed protein product [Pelagomonas calceolata]